MEKILTHIILSDILDEDKYIVVEHGVFEMAGVLLGDLVSVLGERDVSGLVSRVQDLDLGVVVLWEVEVARHSDEARRVWKGEGFRIW